MVIFCCMMSSRLAWTTGDHVSKPENSARSFAVPASAASLRWGCWQRKSWPVFGGSRFSYLHSRGGESNQHLRLNLQLPLPR